VGYDLYTGEIKPSIANKEHEIRERELRET